jgi:microcystin degradation protein MlrC
MENMKNPKIGLVGIALESNAFAPVATAADFRNAIYIEGEEIIDRARAPVAAIQKELSGFVGAMDATGRWQPVPLLDAVCPPWGPVEQEFFDACLSRIDALIAANGPLDGVYVANHGAMVATGDDDPDGTMLARLRLAVGDEVPIIVTLDLHANLSDEMVRAATSVIGYRTNPHVDMTARGEEACLMMRLCLADMAVAGALVRLPLMPPSTTLLTAEGPYADQ